MANPLADIGRSNLGAIGQDLLDRSTAIRREERDMAAQNLGMAIDIEKFNQDRQKNQIAIETAQLQLEDEKKKRAFNNYKIPMSSLNYTLKRGGMPQETIDFLMGEAKTNELIGLDSNGNEYITRENAMMLQQRFVDDVTFREQMFQSTVQGLESEAMQLEQALTNPEKPLKGKEAEAAQARLDALRSPDGPIAQGYNYLENVIPEEKAAETAKIAETPQLFTPTADEVTKFGLEPGTQYMGYYDKDGKLRTVLRPANAEDLGTEKGAKTPADADRWTKAAQSTIYKNLGASEFESLSRDAQPKATAIEYRALQMMDQYDTGVQAGNAALREYRKVPENVNKLLDAYAADTEKGKTIRTQFPSFEEWNTYVMDKVKERWGTASVWGRDIPRWTVK